MPALKRPGDLQRLTLEAGISTPAVNLDPVSGLIMLSGESYPENSQEFYRPIQDWVDSLLASGAKVVAVDLALSYINTGSIKSLMDLFDTLEDAYGSGRRVSVTWRYASGNPRAREAAEEFREDVSFPFDIVLME